ncbi:MAG: UDP-glucose/GDP-mannose dehydrogenase family protein [Bacteroidetes bacterium]|nr:UDP-glucose/GDP-mannose dehydrogenase family protein [Bacteroidota bacterium]
MTIGILGIGKLGLCFGLNLERAGYTVVGVDISESYVKQLNDKSFCSYEPQVNEWLQHARHLTVHTQIDQVLIEPISLTFVMVATPSLPDGGYDHSQIERVVEQLIVFGHTVQRVDLVIGCTVMPGYCDTLQERLAPFNYQVSYNPEFIAQGSIIHDQLYPDQILIGEADAAIGDALEAIYRNMCKSDFTVCRMNRISAEIAKLATNCFLTTKISFANSVGDLATTAGADAEKILEAIGADSRIGSKYLKYGFGFGGPCFPRDNRALNLFARNSGYNLLISEATDNVNRQHLQFQYEQYMKDYKPDEVIVFDEVVYKPGTVILEEAQPLELAKRLVKSGRKVLIKEKVAIIEELTKQYGSLFQYELKS